MEIEWDACISAENLAGTSGFSVIPSVPTLPTRSDVCKTLYSSRPRAEEWPSMQTKALLGLTTTCNSGLWSCPWTQGHLLAGLPLDTYTPWILLLGFSDSVGGCEVFVRAFDCIGVFVHGAGHREPQASFMMVRGPSTNPDPPGNLDS